CKCFTVHHGRLPAVWETGHYGRVSTDMRADNADGGILFLDCQTNFTVLSNSLGDGLVLRNTTCTKKHV
ncbi:Hypothetical predicted protein, partial [Paramuricea clavata]